MAEPRSATAALAVAWALEQQGKLLHNVDVQALNDVCDTLLGAFNGADPGELREWADRIQRCPRTAGILLSGLTQIVSRNYKTFEARFKHLISTLVSRYQDLFKRVALEDEGADGGGGEDADDDDDDDPEERAVTAAAKKRRQAGVKRRAAVLLPPPADTLAILAPSPEVVFRKPNKVAKLTQDMSWLNDPQFVLDIAAADSLIVQEFSQQSAPHSSGQGGGVESSLKNLLGSIAENEPFIIDEPDETFFHFDETAATGEVYMDVEPPSDNFYEAKTPISHAQPLHEEVIHLHERSVMRPLAVDLDLETEPQPHHHAKKKQANAKSAPQVTKLQRAVPDDEISVPLLISGPRECESVARIDQIDTVVEVPSFWQFAHDFLVSGMNVVETFAVRDQIALKSDASDWSFPAPQYDSTMDEPTFAARDSMAPESAFSFAPPPSAIAIANTPLPATGALLPMSAADRPESDILTQALSTQSASSVSYRANALQNVLITIFGRCRDPVPWVCVLPPNAMRWQAAVCMGALLQLLAQGSFVAEQKTPFGRLMLAPPSLKRRGSLTETDDKENKRPRTGAS